MEIEKSQKRDNVRQTSSTDQNRKEQQAVGCAIYAQRSDWLSSFALFTVVGKWVDDVAEGRLGKEG